MARTARVAALVVGSTLDIDVATSQGSLQPAQIMAEGLSSGNLQLPCLVPRMVIWRPAASAAIAVKPEDFHWIC